MASAFEGLLTGGIMGASAGMGQVAEISLNERAAFRREMAAENLQAIKTRDKLETASAKPVKDPKVVTVDELDPETGDRVKNQRELDRTTGTYNRLVTGEDVDKYSDIVNALRAKGVPDKQIPSIFKRDTGGTMPTGVVAKVPAKQYQRRSRNNRNGSKQTQNVR